MAYKTVKPLDSAALEALTLRYVERFATSREKLRRYLLRKVRERGWVDESPPPVDDIVARVAGFGFVDDRAYAGAKGRAMARRGLGTRRIEQQLQADGIDAALREEARAEHDGWQAAVALARRKRLGPFGPPPIDRRGEQRAIAAFLRAGHDLTTARAILAAASVEALDAPD